jgi:putative membrane protein
MFEYGGHWSGWDLALMSLMMVVFWGLVIWAGYLVFSNLSRQRPSAGPADPVALLVERFAKGEIDADEYRSRRELLVADGRTPTGGVGR